jgi:putative hydrolase of the HAD superfamily
MKPASSTRFRPATRPNVIRNVVFDLGGVLITWRPQEVIDSFYADPLLRAAVRRDAFQHPDWIEMDRGTLDEQTIGARFAERLQRPPSEMAALFDHVRMCLKPIPPTVDLARGLRDRGLSLYVLSNISEPMFRHIEGYPLFELFAGAVISGAVKMVKPERAIFEHLVTRFALEHAETVFIDDVARNVEAARAVGLRSILFEDAEQCARELEPLLAR